MRYLLVLMLGAVMGCGSVAAHPDAGAGGAAGGGGVGGNRDASTSDTPGQGGAGGTSSGNACVVGTSQVGSCTL
jgi:hypothetical protein